MIKNGTSHMDISVQRVQPKGRGVFAKTVFCEGDLVLESRPATGPVARSWATIQVDVDTHIIPDEPFRFANHSCEPTCGLQANKHGTYDLIALRDIAEGEEITWDYCMCEWEIIGFKTCHCGSEACRGSISGAKDLPKSFFDKHSEFLAPYYSKMIMAD